MYDDVELFMNDEINSASIEKFETIEKNGGRIEKRICERVTDISWLDARNEWAGLKAVFSVRRIVTTRGATTDEICYYITSLDSQAEELLRISREHWKIESLHWLLDVVFSEDECGILSENGHKTLNIFRKLALFLHKQYLTVRLKKCSTKANLLNCLLNENLLCNILGIL